MKIYHAGMEHCFDKLLEEGIIRNGLYSYYYLREGKRIEKLKAGKKTLKKILIDSGAHSFFSEQEGAYLSLSEKKKSKTKLPPKEYFNQYREWLRKHWELFDYFVELDIGEIVGQGQVEAWRKELKKEGLIEKCITVCHPKIINWQEYLSMLDNSVSRYVAIEGDRQRRKRLPYNKFLKPAYKKGVRVHGFALIKKQLIESCPFYSVDSTNWRAGNMYGRGMVSTNQGIRYVDMSLRRRSTDIFGLVGTGAIEGLLAKKKAYLIDRAAIMALNEYEDIINELWKRRGIEWN